MTSQYKAWFSEKIPDECVSWTSWIDSSPCLLNPATGAGFRYRKRCCGNQSNDFDQCNDEQDIVECLPRECINVQCKCNLHIGVKNGVCSGQDFQKYTLTLYNKAHITFTQINNLDGNNLGTLNNTECGCVQEDCSSECTGYTLLYLIEIYYFIQK